MKVIIASLVAAIALAVGASFVLNTTQRPAFEAYSSPTGARVGDPGHNLVGPNWNGQGQGEAGHKTSQS